MFRNIEWAEYGGAAAMSIAGDFVASGKVPMGSLTAQQGKMIAEGVVILADLAFSDKLHGAMGDALDGAAVYAAGDLIGSWVGPYITGVSKTTTSTSTSGTGASADYQLAPAVAAPAPAFDTTSQSFAQDW